MPHHTTTADQCSETLMLVEPWRDGRELGGRNARQADGWYGVKTKEEIF